MRRPTPKKAPEPAKKKEQPLTKKEAGFIKDYVRTGNGTKAALNNYNTKSAKVAGVIAAENLAKPRIKKHVKSFADGIPDKLLRERHLELLNVPRKIRVSVKGEVQEEVEELDSNAVKAGLDMAYKIKGYYKESLEAPDRGVDPTLQSLNEVVKMLQEERAKRQA